MGENGTEISGLETAHREVAIIKLWQTMGAHKLANQIVASLGAQSIRALEMVRDEKLFLVTGHTTIEDFLDHHPESPMSYEAFRRRANLLNSEGEIAFDLLNSLKVPLSQRKLLAGQIEVADDVIKIGEDVVRLDDGARIVELISKLHSKDLEQQRTIKRHEAKLKKGEADFERLKRQAIVSNPDGTETGQALLTAAGALKNLRDKLEEATPEEKHALSEQIFALMSHSQLELSAALGVSSKSPVKATGNGDGGEDNDPLAVSESEAAEILGEE